MTRGSRGVGGECDRGDAVDRGGVGGRDRACAGGGRPGAPAVVVGGGVGAGAVGAADRAGPATDGTDVRERDLSNGRLAVARGGVQRERAGAGGAEELGLAAGVVVLVAGARQLGRCRHRNARRVGVDLRGRGDGRRDVADPVGDRKGVAVAVTARDGGVRAGEAAGVGCEVGTGARDQVTRLPRDAPRREIQAGAGTVIAVGVREGHRSRAVVRRVRARQRQRLTRRSSRISCQRDRVRAAVRGLVGA